MGSTGKRFFACPSTYKSARQTSDWRQNDSPRFIWRLTGSARFIQLDSARFYFWGLISIHAALALSRIFKQDDSARRFIGWAGRFNSIHLRSDRYSCCPCVEQDIQEVVFNVSHFVNHVILKTLCNNALLLSICRYQWHHDHNAGVPQFTRRCIHIFYTSSRKVTIEFKLLYRHLHLSPNVFWAATIVISHFGI